MLYAAVPTSNAHEEAEVPKDIPLDPDGDEFVKDLHAHMFEGENYGIQSRDPVREGWAPTAYDIKPVHKRLEQFSDDELKRVPILPEGTRLEQGATYIDLHAEEPREFKAMGSMTAEPHNWYVPKKDVAYQTWDKLLDAVTAERPRTG